MNDPDQRLPDRRLVVRPACAEDLAGLPALDAAADALLASHLDAPLPPAPDVEAAVAALARAAAVLVVGTPPVGFARIEVVDGGAHLEQLVGGTAVA